jgi:Fe-S cluster biogenesis protein NfuA
MSPTTIKIKPQDRRTCRFITESPIGAGEARFARSEAPYGNEMADAILGLPGVEEVVVSGDTVTVVKSDDREWTALEEPIAYALQLGVQAGDAPTVPMAELDEDDLFDDIERFFEQEINPQVASHGGKVELIDIQDLTLVVRMMGGCQGCGMANVTLKQGIEGNIRKVWPMIRGIRDVTDHASGTNPYFESSK